MGKGRAGPKVKSELTDDKFESVIEYDTIDRILAPSIVTFYKDRKHVATINNVEQKIYISKTL